MSKRIDVTDIGFINEIEIVELTKLVIIHINRTFGRLFKAPYVLQTVLQHWPGQHAQRGMSWHKLESRNRLKVWFRYLINTSVQRWRKEGRKVWSLEKAIDSMKCSNGIAFLKGYQQKRKDRIQYNIWKIGLNRTEKERERERGKWNCGWQQMKCNINMSTLEN